LRVGAGDGPRPGLEHSFQFFQAGAALIRAAQLAVTLQVLGYFLHPSLITGFLGRFFEPCIGKPSQPAEHHFVAAAVLFLRFEYFE
jgi:hypothetical protein